MNNSKESSMTITSIAHFTQLQHYVHFYHMQKILYPQSKETTLSINMTAKTEAVYFGESKGTIALRTKEYTRAVRAADTRRYETADHCWKYNHDLDWENKKIIDYETNTTRKIKETIHSLSNNNHISGMSHGLPHIWFPALKFKGGSEVNTSSNQNEETNNQSQASTVSTQVRHQRIKSADQPTITLFLKKSLIFDLFIAIQHICG